MIKKSKQSSTYFDIEWVILMSGEFDSPILICPS